MWGCRSCAAAAHHCNYFAPPPLCYLQTLSTLLYHAVLWAAWCCLVTMPSHLHCVDPNHKLNTGSDTTRFAPSLAHRHHRQTSQSRSGLCPTVRTALTPACTAARAGQSTTRLSARPPHPTPPLPPYRRHMSALPHPMTPLTHHSHLHPLPLGRLRSLRPLSLPSLLLHV